MVFKCFGDINSLNPPKNPKRVDTKVIVIYKCGDWGLEGYIVCLLSHSQEVSESGPKFNSEEGQISLLSIIFSCLPFPVADIELQNVKYS